MTAGGGRRTSLGTSACPPYHLAIVVGGLSAEMTLQTVKYASAKYLDELPTSGDESGRAFRDLEVEAEVHNYTPSCAHRKYRYR